MKDIKMNMRAKARMASGLLNLLSDDIFHLSTDTNDFDLISLEVSIQDTKSTIQMLVDNIAELEYQLYLCKRNSREKQAPL